MVSVLFDLTQASNFLLQRTYFCAMHMDHRHHLPNDRFLSLLQERRKRRAAILSSVLTEPQTSSLQPDQEPISPFLSKSRSAVQGLSSNSESNLSTHYLFSSSRPQNEIQNPYPNCFEGYPKLQKSQSSSLRAMLIS